MTRLLASVRSVEEAQIAAAASADLIDLKEPARGTLGALDIAVVREIVGACAGQRPLSATVGDLPPEPQVITSQATALADAGVDYIKIGFFDARYFESCAGALQPIAQKHALVGVLFADRLNDFAGPCQLLQRAGFSGVMIDTADKAQGSVRQFVDEATLQRFVTAARERSLLCGIAGSLTLDDIAPLAALEPDYLGFRTALCKDGRRENALCEQRIAEVARQLRSPQDIGNAA